MTPYHFNMYSVSTNVNTAVFGSFALSYGPIRLTGPTELSLSAQADIGKISTPQVIYAADNVARLTSSLSFIGILAKLDVSAPLSPYIKAGAGVLDYDAQETYSADAYDNNSVRHTRFAVTAEGGIDIEISSALSFSVFGEGVTLTANPQVSYMLLGVRVNVPII